MKSRGVGRQTVLDHFDARSERYDYSSHWVADDAMGDQVRTWLEAGSGDDVLDIASGTGRWASAFFGRVRSVVGVDITPAMSRPGRRYLNHFVQANAEVLPFKDDSFDLVVERQGIQFMDASAVVGEMVRVAKPGGRICLVQLCARGVDDAEEYFEILRLRNPARRNFFIREDLGKLLLDAGCASAEVRDWVTKENVDAWANNGAIGDERQEAIRRCYEQASEAFKGYHMVALEDGHYVDRMLFGVAIGVKS